MKPVSKGKRVRISKCVSALAAMAVLASAAISAAEMGVANADPKPCTDSGPHSNFYNGYLTLQNCNSIYYNAHIAFYDGAKWEPSTCSIEMPPHQLHTYSVGYLDTYCGLKGERSSVRVNSYTAQYV